MKNKILAILALFVMTACSSTNEDSTLSTAWSNITSFSSANTALKEYTSLINKHSKEKWANHSAKIVETCHINTQGMTESDLIKMINDNVKTAETCWDMLVEYPKTDVRFYKEGKVEKEVLAKFENAKEELAELF